MTNNEIIQSFISDVDNGITPSKDTLKSVAEILKPTIKRKTGPTDPLDKSIENVEGVIKMIEYFLETEKFVGRGESLAETAVKYHVSERTVERKIKKFSPFIKLRIEWLAQNLKLQEIHQSKTPGSISKTKIKSFVQSVVKELNKK